MHARHRFSTKFWLFAATALLTSNMPAWSCLQPGIGAEKLAPPVVGNVTTHFGMIHMLGTTILHAGEDFAGRVGEPVHAAQAGVVTFAGREAGYGNRIVVDHGGGLSTTYSHLQKLEVGVGACVSRAQDIGTEGTTGLSTGPHLHFEVRRNGTPVDPQPFLGPPTS